MVSRAKKPAISAVEYAQMNLCRKLGLYADELTPIEEVMREFIAAFHGPQSARRRCHVNNLCWV
jgi:hypothetical protein